MSETSRPPSPPMKLTIWDCCVHRALLISLYSGPPWLPRPLLLSNTTGGVYPIATANDKSQISAPLMSRFAVIDIPDYTPEEKKIIFSKYAMPKVLKRMGLHENECVVTEDALDAVIEKYADTTGIRDLEQAAEHMAANALYQIEVDNVAAVVFDGDMVRELLG